MRKRKLERCEKRQRGQFLTPASLARDIVAVLNLSDVRRILEPSCGDGSFIRAIVDRLLSPCAREGRSSDGNPSVNLVGVEIDETLLATARRALPIKRAKQDLRLDCELLNGDFFHLFMERNALVPCGSQASALRGFFDLIVGNPPFGGSFDPKIEDELDSLLGKRLGHKIKKETYAFFIVACVELLRPGGRLVFVCSDSMLTIPTMTGLRNFLTRTGKVVLHELKEFSSETNYPMFVLEYVHERGEGTVLRFEEQLRPADIEATPNLSWGVTPRLASMFRGPKLGDFFVASSGMTTGKNEFFVREISEENTIEESFDFHFSHVPITVEGELKRARLNTLSPGKRMKLAEAERSGRTERRVSIEPKACALTIRLPHPNYAPYNKGNGRIVYSPPTHVIYWKNDGDAVLTYKRTGNWYLRGVGGQPFFFREGLTWQLVASRFVPRYLPPGYVLDSGAPCAFVLDGVPRNELFFAIGWLLSPVANQILKTVVNHTRNIQSKDFERMPYPWWVRPDVKADAIKTVERLVAAAEKGRRWDRRDREFVELTAMYGFCKGESYRMPVVGAGRKAPRLREAAQLTLFG